jgi:hypothetical protein
VGDLREESVREEGARQGANSDLSEFRGPIGSRAFDRCLLLEVESISSIANLSIGTHAPEIHHYWLHVIAQQDCQAKGRERERDGERLRGRE